MSKAIDRIGQTFGRLTIIKKAPTKKRSDGNGTFTYWTCICSCGKEVTTRTNGLVSGNTKSCGCLIGESQTNKAMLDYPPGKAGFLRVFRGYEWAAKKRNYSFNLSEEDFSRLTKQNCHYCGSPPKKIMSTGCDHSKYLYNGVDRTDNSKGYEIDNCLPCCEICNKAKGTYTYDEFILWIKRLIKFRNSQ